MDQNKALETEQLGLTLHKRGQETEASRHALPGPPPAARTSTCSHVNAGIDVQSSHQSDESAETAATHDGHTFKATLPLLWCDKYSLFSFSESVKTKLTSLLWFDDQQLQKDRKMDRQYSVQVGSCNLL